MDDDFGFFLIFVLLIWACIFIPLIAIAADEDGPSFKEDCKDQKGTYLMVGSDESCTIDGNVVQND